MWANHIIEQLTKGETVQFRPWTKHIYGKLIKVEQ